MGSNYKGRGKPGWVVNHLWDNAPEPIYFWDGEVAERYIDEAFLWADLITGEPLAECRAISIPSELHSMVHTGFPAHQLHFYKCGTFIVGEDTWLVLKDEPIIDALLYFDFLHYDPEEYPAIYAEGMHLEIIPHKSITGQNRVHLYVEGSELSEVDEFFDREAAGLQRMTLDDVVEEKSSNE